jgi:hypothetical protein
MKTAVTAVFVGKERIFIRETLDAGTASDEVILNILSQRRDPPPVRPLDVVVDLQLNHPPIADCARYDPVRGLNAAA